VRASSPQEREAQNRSRADARNGHRDTILDYRLMPPSAEAQLRFARYTAMLRDAWSEWRFEPERFIDAGDQVVVFGRVVAKGRGSGAPIERASAVVLTVRDGRIASSQVYPDRAEALKAVGLE